MPGMRRLTIGAIRKAIAELGGVGKATWAGVAQRTGHSLDEVKAVGEKHGLSLRDRLSSPSAPGVAPVGEPELLEIPGLVNDVTDMTWDHVTGKLPRFPRRWWDILLGEWHRENRTKGDKTPFDVLFLHHVMYPELERKLASVKADLARFRSEGAYARGLAKGRKVGHREGSEEGYNRGWEAALSRVEMTCQACRRAILVDFGVRDGKPTPHRELLDVILDPPSGQSPVLHVDCQRPELGFTIALRNSLETGNEKPWAVFPDRGNGRYSKTPFLTD